MYFFRNSCLLAFLLMAGMLHAAGGSMPVRPTWFGICCPSDRGKVYKSYFEMIAADWLLRSAIAGNCKDDAALALMGGAHVDKRIYREGLCPDPKDGIAASMVYQAAIKLSFNVLEAIIEHMTYLKNVADSGDFIRIRQSLEFYNELLIGHAELQEWAELQKEATKNERLEKTLEHVKVLLDLMISMGSTA